MDLSLYGFDGLRQVLNVHPAFVHFPIALLPAALFFYALGVLRKNSCMLAAGRGCLYLGFLSVLITIATGLAAEENVPHNQRIHQIIQTHKSTGWIILLLTLALVIWSFLHRQHQPKGRWAFILLMAVSCYFVLQNGDLGSRMVYVEGAAMKPAVEVVTGAQHPHGEILPEHEHSAGAPAHSHEH